jgi:starch-binding outer membrane protein, SusD/RagB family
MKVGISKALAAAASLISLGALACTDLTVEPKSTVTEANIFADVNSYRSFIAKVYAGLAVGGQQGGDGQTDIQGIDGGFSQYIRLYWEHEELPTDEAVIAWGDPGLPDLNKQSWGATNPFVAAMYYRIYFQIGMANEFLRQSTDEKLASRGQTALKATLATYRAEARFLRALSYWHGIDLFGDIPLVTDADQLGSTPPQQATRADIYNFIVSELTAIQGDLPAPGPTAYGRATAPAASMLLAKLYLNAAVYTGTANYAGALTAAQAVIAGPYTLDPSFRHNFQADNNTSPEIVFAVPEDGLKTQTYGSTNFLIHASCGTDMNSNDYGVDGCWYGLRLKPEAYNKFGSGDSRASFFVATAGHGPAIVNIGTFEDGIKAPKYSNRTSTGGAGQNPGFADTDFPMFRLADAYLIYAEAVLRGGGGTRAQALIYLNALRQRAYGNTSGNITDAQMTLDFILDERARELLWEGHRRTDLVRYGRFTGGTYLWAWKGGVAGGTTTDVHLNLFPLPANELVANPNLHQNPGY